VTELVIEHIRSDLQEPLGTGIDIIDLPSEGIVGNSHFLMMDATPMRFSRAWRVGSTP
jgi:hypothetical protein